MATHVCPVWVGYLLASPLRRMFEPVERIFGDHVGAGMTVLDVGCAMGYFSLPAARTVGPEGRVVAVDLQPRMLDVLKKRATRRGLADRIDLRACTDDGLGLEDLAGAVDVALAIHMIHEASEGGGVISEIFESLRPGGVLIVGEPSGHVNEETFEETLGWGAVAGFDVIDHWETRRARYVTFQRPEVD